MEERLFEIILKVVILGIGVPFFLWMYKKGKKNKIVGVLYILTQMIYIFLLLFILYIMILVTLEQFREGNFSTVMGFVFIFVYLGYATVVKIKISFKKCREIIHSWRKGEESLEEEKRSP